MIEWVKDLGVKSGVLSRRVPIDWEDRHVTVADWHQGGAQEGVEIFLFTI